MIHKIIKNLICVDSTQCSDIIVSKLEGIGMKLKARKINDTVNGSVTIVHEQANHIITVIYYDKDENPNNHHRTIFKKPKNIPTLSEVKSKL